MTAVEDLTEVGRIRGYRPLAGPHPLVGHGFALAAGVRWLARIAAGRPRSVTVRLGVGFGLGLVHLAFLRLFRWDATEPYLPYLAHFALSVGIGSMVCTNAMSMDAARVRAQLSGGTRLWHILLAKNLALLCVVGAVGTLLSVLLASRIGDTDALVKACGLLITMMLLWLGVGNVLSIVAPLRYEPLAARPHDSTLRPFLLSFVVSYGLGYVVDLMLFWRIWAKRTAIEELGGLWLPVLLTVGSAAVIWVLLTVVAATLAEQPGVRRVLLREPVEYPATRGRVFGAPHPRRVTPGRPADGGEHRPTSDGVPTVG